MSISHLLEDFRAYAQGTPLSLTDVSLEEQRLEAFEKGYQAGWDDCAKAADEDSRRVSTDFAQNLLDLSFTYHEAYAAAMDGLRPLLDQMVGVLLPTLAREALGRQIVEEITALAGRHGSRPVEIVTAPANAPALESLLGAELSMPVTVEQDPDLGEGQAYLRFAEQEREVDLRAVLDGIGAKVAGFFEETQKDIA